MARVLLLMLQVLSQRTVSLAGNLLPLIALALGFSLAYKVVDNPTAYQLGAVAIYGVFSLLMLYVVRRK